MVKGALGSGVLLLLLCIQPAHGWESLQPCAEPQAPPPAPDGNTADLATMKAAGLLYREFNAAGERYLACLERNAGITIRAVAVAYLGRTRENESRRIYADYVRSHERFMQRMFATAEEYNVEVRKYNRNRVNASHARQASVRKTSS